MLRNNSMLAGQRVAVFGLGYVGLPLIRSCLNAGSAVIGFDVDKGRVESLRSGFSYVDDVSDIEIQEWLKSGFYPTSEVADLLDIDVFIICVPTPLTKAGGPDLSAVEASTQVIEGCLTRFRESGKKPLVILESTTYPGTTEEVVQPILEKNGLLVSEDFHLAFSPERIDPGNQRWTFENTPKVVGGLTKECGDAAEKFYAQVTTTVVRVKGLKEAEMAKLLENTYRHVNIALINEMAKISHELGIDIWDVIRAAETKPFGFQAFRPSAGVGGHCIPIDPNYLSHRVKTELGLPFRFIELAQEVNSSMPSYVVVRLRDLLNLNGLSVNGAQILVVGVTYKPNIADTRDSPAIGVIRNLLKSGANVFFLDSLIPDFKVDGQAIPSSQSPNAPTKYDAAVILQAHETFSYKDMSPLSDCWLDASSAKSLSTGPEYSRI
jgi:UDP-N-acetyl-D-glucosamine dehydrogenase